MPTPTGLPKVGETWRHTQKFPPDWEAESVDVVVMERSKGDYWSLTVRHRNGKRSLWVDASYYWSKGDLVWVPHPQEAVAS